MESVASELWIWEDAGRVMVRLRTNAAPDRIRRRLDAVGLDGSLEALEGDPDMTRVRGGTSYLLAFGGGVSVDLVRALLARL